MAAGATSGRGPPTPALSAGGEGDLSLPPPPSAHPERSAVLSPSKDDAESKGTSTERDQVVDALTRAGHVQARAARLLGMSVRQLRYRIAKYGIAVERF